MYVAEMDLPRDELQWRFAPAGGPGGQHANRASTKVELRFDVAASRAFDEETKTRILDRLDNPVIVITVDETRSQWRNRMLAQQRLLDRLAAVATPPPPRRKPTKPTRAAQRRRLTRKRRRSEMKRLRRRPETE